MCVCTCVHEGVCLYVRMCLTCVLQGIYALKTHPSLNNRIQHIHTERFYLKEQTKLTLNTTAPERGCEIFPFLALCC